ncbi:MAG: sugar transferase [Saprospiraceae bacterium]
MKPLPLLNTPPVRTNEAKVIAFSLRDQILTKYLKQWGIQSWVTAEVDELLAAMDASPSLIVFELSDLTEAAFKKLRTRMLAHPTWAAIPFVVVSEYPSMKWKTLCRKFAVKDYQLLLTDKSVAGGRIKTLVSPPTATPNQELTVRWHVPLWKRVMDIAGAGLLLLLLSPLFALLALLIKMESKGPVFYVSKRAGQGYKIFDFIKFRSMRSDADSLVDKLRANNQYAQDTDTHLPAEVLRSKPANAAYTVLVEDDAYLFEEEWQEDAANAGTFFKMANDPRITRVGRFIRNTSIDELPQLINVLKGDMSLVGNRPCLCMKPNN